MPNKMISLIHRCFTHVWSDSKASSNCKKIAKHLSRHSRTLKLLYWACVSTYREVFVFQHSECPFESHDFIQKILDRTECFQLMYVTFQSKFRYQSLRSQEEANTPLPTKFLSTLHRARLKCYSVSHLPPLVQTHNTPYFWLITQEYTVFLLKENNQVYLLQGCRH